MLVEHEFETAFEMPTDPAFEVFIGEGTAAPRVPQVSGSVCLPFGLSMPMSAKRKAPAKRVATTGSGLDKREKEDTEQVASEDDEAEAGPSASQAAPASESQPPNDSEASGLVADPVLSNAAATEFEEALCLDKDEVDPDLAGAPVSGVAEGSSARTPSMSAASRATGPARFHSSLGIVGVSLVKRRGVTCAHCNMSMDKGTVRLELAQKINKPGKSLHGGCIMQLPENMVAQSMTFLEQAARNAATDVERSACGDALQMLRSIHRPE